MRKQISVAVVILAALALISATQGNAARETLGLNDQVRILNLSKGVPDQLSYQGYLVDAADSSAVTGTLEMTFRLFDSETKGAELWSETHSMITVNNGLFEVLLGSVTSFPAGLFDGSTLWLQTEVEAEILAPRKPLVSVAYSQRAVNADQATTAGYAADAQHAVHADTAGYVPGISAWTVDGDNVYRETGLVGVGTTSPAAQLHVYNDNDAATATVETGGATNSWAQTRYKTASKEWIVGTSRDFNNNELYIDDGSNALHLNADGTSGFQVGSDAGKYLSLRTGSTDAVHISSVGEVGIGTTGPAYPLDVNGAVNATTYYGDGSNLTSIAGTPDGDWTISGSDMYSGVSGNVGIGTTSPGAPLEVNYNNASSTTPAIVINNSNPAGQSALDFQFQGTLDARLRIAATGGFHIGTVTGADLNLRTNDTQRLHITGDGKVGIGTGSPTSKLHVHEDTGIYAVYATSADTTAIVGIAQDNTGSANGGYFESHANNGNGVYGFSEHGRGVYGVHTHSSHTSPAVYGRNYGSGAGVLGRGYKDQGVYGRSQYGQGIYAENILKSIYAYMADTVWAGYFSGDVHISGNLGIATETPTAALDVNGQARIRTLPSGPGTDLVADGSGNLMLKSSSLRHKQNVRDLETRPEDVLDLRPVRFQWKSSGQEDIGLIAEEVDRVAPDLVIHDLEGRPSAVKYDRVTLYLLELVREQQEQIEKLDNVIREMRDRQ